MRIAALKLERFRNYDQEELVFHPKANLIYGANAQGKTNLLEAIYLLAMAKSHRTHRDQELLKWQNEAAKIRGLIDKKQGQHDLAVYL